MNLRPVSNSRRNRGTIRRQTETSVVVIIHLLCRTQHKDSNKAHKPNSKIYNGYIKIRYVVKCIKNTHTRKKYASSKHFIRLRSPSSLEVAPSHRPLQHHVWATVCKTVHPMMSCRPLSVCLSVCLSVTLVHLNGWNGSR